MGKEVSTFGDTEIKKNKFYFFSLVCFFSFILRKY